MPVTAEVVIEVPVRDVMLTKFDVEVIDVPSIPFSASVVPSKAKSVVVVNTLFCTNGILPVVK